MLQLQLGAELKEVFARITNGDSIIFIAVIITIIVFSLCFLRFSSVAKTWFQ